MGVDDNPSDTPAKQGTRLRIQSIKIKTNVGEKSSLTPAASSESIGGRSLRLRQRTSAGNTEGSEPAEPANSE